MAPQNVWTWAWTWRMCMAKNKPTSNYSQSYHPSCHCQFFSLSFFEFSDELCRSLLASPTPPTLPLVKTVGMHICAVSPWPPLSLLDLLNITLGHKEPVPKSLSRCLSALATTFLHSPWEDRLCSNVVLVRCVSSLRKRCGCFRLKCIRGECGDG